MWWCFKTRQSWSTEYGECFVLQIVFYNSGNHVCHKQYDIFTFPYMIWLETLCSPLVIPQSVKYLRIYGSVQIILIYKRYGKYNTTLLLLSTVYQVLDPCLKYPQNLKTKTLQVIWEWFPNVFAVKIFE